MGSSDLERAAEIETTGGNAVVGQRRTLCCDARISLDSLAGILDGILLYTIRSYSNKISCMFGRRLIKGLSAVGISIFLLFLTHGDSCNECRKKLLRAIEHTEKRAVGPYDFYIPGEVR